MASVKKSALSNLTMPAKLAVGLFMVALPAFAYYLVFHSDIQAEINAAETRHAGLQSELVAAQKAEDVYSQDVEELNRRERNKAELMKVLPEKAEYHAFLSSIQNVANLVGVELLAWTPREEVPDQFYARVPMQLELRGRFHQLARFFYNVGQSERIINMEDIVIKSPPAKDDEVLLTVTVLATAFHALGDTQPTQPKRNRRDR